MDQASAVVTEGAPPGAVPGPGGIRLPADLAAMPAGDVIAVRDDAITALDAGVPGARAVAGAAVAELAARLAALPGVQ
jgi:hypothetical protein